MPTANVVYTSKDPARLASLSDGDLARLFGPIVVTHDKCMRPIIARSVDVGEVA